MEIHTKSPRHQDTFDSIPEFWSSSSPLPSSSSSSLLSLLSSSPPTSLLGQI